LYIRKRKIIKKNKNLLLSFERRWRQKIVTVASQPDAVEAVEDLGVRISLRHHVRHPHLHAAIVPAQSASHPRHRADLHHSDEARRELVAAAADDGGGIGVVKPENAGDAAGAVVNDEAEEPLVLEVAQGDGAKGFDERERDSSAGKRR